MTRFARLAFLMMAFAAIGLTLPVPAGAQTACFDIFHCPMTGVDKCIIDAPVGWDLVSGASTCFWAQFYPCKRWSTAEPCITPVELQSLEREALLALADVEVQEVTISGVTVMVAAVLPAETVTPALLADWVDLQNSRCAARNETSSSTN